MPTIKTNNAGGIRRVVTKTSSGNRRVSCSCCPTGVCCLYPGEEGFGIGAFGLNDFPEELEIWLSGDPIYSPGVVGPSIATYNGDATWGALNPDPTGRPQGPYVEFSGDGYVVTLAGGYPGGPATCLILNYNETPVSGLKRYYIFDRFLDTYTVTDPTGILSQQVTRTSLCNWTGTGIPNVQESVINIDYNAVYEDGPFDPDQPLFKWVMTFGEAGSRQSKDGFQNTPAGNYITGAGTFVVS